MGALRDPGAMGASMTKPTGGFWPTLAKSFWAVVALVLGLAAFASPAAAQLRSGYNYTGGSNTTTTTISSSGTVAYVGTAFNFTATVSGAGSCPCGGIAIYGRPEGTNGTGTQISNTGFGTQAGVPANGSWTPPSAGTYEVWAEFQPSGVNRQSQSGLLVITVLAAPPGTPAVLPSSLPTPVIGTFYSQNVTAAGGTAPYLFSITGGSLPPGLIMTSGGLISGTPTGGGGAYSFTVGVTDNVGATGSTTYSGTIAAPPVTVVLSPSSGALTGGTVGAGYSQTFTASGGATPYAFAVTAGALPPGLTLTSGGVLSGTPSASGTFNFTVTATDNNGVTGSAAYSINVALAPITLAPTTLPNGTNGTAYSQTVTASGGTGAGFTYAVTAGALPGGLSLNTSSGAITGTPNAAGSYNFTITATDNGSNTGSQAYSMTINPGVVLTVNPTSLTAGTNGTAYSATISATGGTGTGYTFAVTGGSLPGGLTLASNGTLSGTPNAAGSYNFTVTATDSAGNTGVRTYPMTINPGVVLTVNPTSLTAGTNGTAYSATISATGGTGTGYTFAVTGGSLPGGLTLASNGTLSGTPNAAGSYNFTVTATDSAGNTGVRTYTMTINPGAVLTINPATLATGRHRIAYSQTLSATGGTGTGYTYSVTAGALPSGLSLTSAGVLSGTPTVYGNFAFTARVQDSAGNFGTRAYNLVITARPDPSQDPRVRELVAAQFTMSQRFAETQISNVSRHLEGLSSGCERDRQNVEACRDNGFSFWMAGASDGSSRFGQDFSTRSATLGVDYWLSPNAVIGLAGGLADNDQSVGTFGSRINGDSETLTAYGRFSPAAGVNISGLYGWGTQTASLRRQITADGSFATGDRDGDLQFGSIGISLDHVYGDLSIMPYARYDYVKVDLDAYSEQGSSPYILSYEASSREITSLVAGVRVTMPEALLGRPFVRLETRNRDLGRYDQDLSYADYGADVYRVTDVGGSDQIWSGGVGTEMRLGPGALRVEAGFSDIAERSLEGLSVRMEYRIGSF